MNVHFFLSSVNKTAFNNTRAVKPLTGRVKQGVLGNLFFSNILILMGFGQDLLFFFCWTGLLTISLQSSLLSVHICWKWGHAASSRANFLESGKVNLVPASNALNAFLSQIVKWNLAEGRMTGQYLVLLESETMWKLRWKCISKLEGCKNREYAWSFCHDISPMF